MVTFLLLASKNYRRYRFSLGAELHVRYLSTDGHQQTVVVPSTPPQPNVIVTPLPQTHDFCNDHSDTRFRRRTRVSEVGDGLQTVPKRVRCLDARFVPGALHRTT